MSKPKVAVTGLSGFLGTAILPTLVKYFSIYDLYNSKPVTIPGITSIQLNLLKEQIITPILYDVQPDHILHMAAATHVDRCEADRSNGKNGRVWKLNVSATQKILEFAEETKTHCTLLSTECVFDGLAESYTEKDKPNPKNWYGVTKAAAEKLLLSSNAPAAVLRAVIAYNFDKVSSSIYGKLFQQLSAGKPFFAVSDQRITPTHTDHIADAIVKIIQHSSTGTFHVAPTDSLTPYEFAQLVADANRFKKNLVQPKTLLEFFGSTRAQLRLKHAVLNAEKSRKILGLLPKTTTEVFATMAE